MPYAPNKPCSRCRKPTRNQGGLCDVCQARAKAKATVGPKKATKPFYGKAVWKNARNKYINEYPLCELCKAKGISTRSAFVDHIHEIEDGGAKLSESNFMALCRACHAKKTKDMSKARAIGNAEVKALIGKLKLAVGRGG